MSLGATAAPAAIASTWTQAELDARYQRYRERINELLAGDADQATIDRTIEDEFGIVRLDLGRALSPIVSKTAGSAGANVVMYTPTFSYDRMVGSYVMAASWEWKACPEYNRACWTKDKTSAGNVGGQDGMSIQVNAKISRDNAGLSTSDNCGSPAMNTPNADNDAKDYGVGFPEQDEVTYSSANGMCAGTHTWETTSTNYVGISANGIEYGWTKESHRWSAIPPAPAHAAC